MYKFLLNTHLALSLIILPFLAIYAVSALFFSHSFLDFSATEKKVGAVELKASLIDPLKIADLLTKEYGIRGQLKNSSKDDSGTIELLISRPGTQHKVVVDPGSGVALIEEESKNIGGFIKALHVSAGFQNNVSVQWWWGFVVLLVALLLMGILITGLLLWVYRTKERVSGLIFLGVSVAYSVSVLCVLRFG